MVSPGAVGTVNIVLVTRLLGNHFVVDSEYFHVMRVPL
jgi:hypothetical protein